MRRIKELECKLANWREKAKTRSKLIAELYKRITELICSRNSWKAKYYEVKAEKEALEASLSSISGEKPIKIKHHSYTSEQISLSLELRHQGGCSYRSCRSVLKIISDWGNYNWRLPSHTTIRDWDIKSGYQEIQQPKEEKSKYALIMDESITIGSQKVLLMLGAKLGTYNFDNPLNISDIDVLNMGIGRSWKAPEICKLIEASQNRNCIFEYGCCDNGNNLRKALKDSKIKHIEDCGHALGAYLKKKYKEDAIFQALSKDVRKFKLKIQNGQNAAYAPPKWRTKGRFLNLWPVCKWTKNLLSLVKDYQQQTNPPEVLSDLVWIVEYESFIEQIHQEQQLINKINKTLKSKGLCEQTVDNCKTFIEETKIDQDFKNQLLDYLNRNWEKAKQLIKVICSSDIIESIFGKFKNLVGKHPQGGVTTGALTIANYGKAFNPLNIKNAFEKVTLKLIEKWRKDNLSLSIFQQKKRLFKNTG